MAPFGQGVATPMVETAKTPQKKTGSKHPINENFELPTSVNVCKRLGRF